MQFKSEKISDILEESKPLLQKHWDEIAHFKDIPLNPDYDQYLKLEQMGITRSYSARMEDGKLIGYAVFFIRPNLHYKDSIQALQDIIFIDKNYRGAGLGLIKFCDRMLKEEGIQVVFQHIKASHNFGPALERMNYELVDLIYAKRLDK